MHTVRHEAAKSGAGSCTITIVAAIDLPVKCQPRYRAKRGHIRRFQRLSSEI